MTPSRVRRGNDRNHKVSRRATRLGQGVALGLAAALMAACGGSSGSEDASSSGPDDFTFLNILPIESLTFSPEMVADACGYFKDEGLNVKFQTTQGSAPAIQTVIAGGAELTRVGDIETMLAAGDKGAPVVDIGTSTHLGTIRIVSSTRAPITSAADFKGKTVGLPSEGGTSEITLDMILNSAGINPEETDRQVVGLTPAVFDLVKSGRIDAYVVSLDTAIALEQSQRDAVVYDPAEAIHAGAQLYMTSQEQMDDPETSDEIQRYLKAIRTTMDMIIKDKATGFKKTMKCISSKYDVPTLADKKVAEASLTGYVDSWTAHGADQILKTNPQQWQATYKELASGGMIDGGMNAQDWYTNDLSPSP